MGYDDYALLISEALERLNRILVLSSDHIGMTKEARAMCSRACL